MSNADVRIQNEGSIFLFHPLTEAAKQWMQEHVLSDEAQFFGKALVVEHRYAGHLAEGMANDGLVVE